MSIIIITITKANFIPKKVLIQLISIDGSPLSLKPWHTLCSVHFIGGKKSDDENSPSYVPQSFPTIDSTNKVDKHGTSTRHQCFMARKKIKLEVTILQPKIQIIENVNETNSDESLLVDEEYKVNVPFDTKHIESTFTYYRYIDNNYCDAEIKVGLPTNPNNVVNSTCQIKDLCCDEETKNYIKEIKSLLTFKKDHMKEYNKAQK
ncbi:uncharacterized protein LOC122514406 [Polistes fuscatus]|uniref:uncharacterized protein LOC122514406 n=1 Tax=Polistes fuscatus TaxID=30207 RepID=UPI001CA9FFF1|nr:uncharacterized protein LOC122514406 [Polistes fuscatus]